MTIRWMATIALAAGLALGPACTPDDPATEQDAEHDPGQEALDAVTALERMIDELRADVADDTSQASDDLEEVEAELRKVLRQLRQKVRDARGETRAALEDAAAAVARAAAVAADLEVLEERYNFHLRRYHGGG